MNRSRTAVLASASLLDDETQGVDVLRLDLTDIPRLPSTLEVEGLEPTLLSRLFDLFSPRTR